MTVNKYYLYIFIVLAICLPTLGPKLYYRLTYERATGVVDGYHAEEVRTKKGKRIKRYPRIVFKAPGGEVVFYATSLLYDQTSDGHRVVVLYNKKDPTKAFVQNSLGLFGPDLVWILPVFLILTGCFLGPGIIPTRFKI